MLVSREASSTKVKVRGDELQESEVHGPKAPRIIGRLPGDSTHICSEIEGLGSNCNCHNNRC